MHALTHTIHPLTHNTSWSRYKTPYVIASAAHLVSYPTLVTPPYLADITTRTTYLYILLQSICLYTSTLYHTQTHRPYTLLLNIHTLTPTLTRTRTYTPAHCTPNGHTHKTHRPSFGQYAANYTVARVISTQLRSINHTQTQLHV